MGQDARLGACGLGLILVPVASVMAQGPFAYLDAPSSEKTARWLRSGTAQDRAWGAYYAVKTKDVSFLPVLEWLAERWEPLPHRSLIVPPFKPEPKLDPWQTDERDAMTAVLDGVIVLDGKLPAEALERLAGDFPVQTAILLARLPAVEIEPMLLTLYHDPAPPHGLQQRLAAEMLAVRPPPGFAASLMKGTTVLGKVTVSLPGEG